MVKAFAFGQLRCDEWSSIDVCTSCVLGRKVLMLVVVCHSSITFVGCQHCCCTTHILSCGCRLYVRVYCKK